LRDHFGDGACKAGGDVDGTLAFGEHRSFPSI
jgi:hypothetical protein